MLVWCCYTDPPSKVQEQKNSIWSDLSEYLALIAMSEEMQAAGRVDIDYDERERRREELKILLYQNESEWEEVVKIDSQLEELGKYRFEADEALGRIIARTNRYWGYNHRPNLLYQAYTEPQELEADGAQLLYFQLAGKPDITDIFEQFSHDSELHIVERRRRAGWISTFDSSSEEDNF